MGTQDYTFSLTSDFTKIYWVSVTFMKVFQGELNAPREDFDVLPEMRCALCLSAFIAYIIVLVYWLFILYVIGLFVMTVFVNVPDGFIRMGMREVSGLNTQMNQWKLADLQAWTWVSVFGVQVYFCTSFRNSTSIPLIRLWLLIVFHFWRNKVHHFVAWFHWANLMTSLGVGHAWWGLCMSNVLTIASDLGAILLTYAIDKW